MTEYIACPQCGTTQPAQQKFCGECGAALREGVTRPLTADERIMLEGRARLAGDSQARAGAGREPARRSPLITALLLGCVLLLLAGAGFGLSSLVAGQPDGTLVEQGAGASLGPGVIISFTRTIVQASSVPTTCKGGVSTVWSFIIANTNPANANILVDRSSIRLVDSTGRSYTGQHQCYLELSDFIAKPMSLLNGSSLKASVTLDIDELPAAATHLDLHMTVSGKAYTFRAPFP